MYASEPTAQPKFQEPVYLCEIQTPNDCVESIYHLMTQRRGIIISEEPIIGIPLVNLNISNKIQVPSAPPKKFMDVIFYSSLQEQNSWEDFFRRLFLISAFIIALYNINNMNIYIESKSVWDTVLE